MSELVALRLTGAALAGRIEDVWARGDAALPLDPSAPDAEVRRLLALARPAKMVTAEGGERLPDAVPAGEDAALVVPTSGTSGDAKLVELGHAALEASARAASARIGATRADRWLACVPMHHVAGLSILVRSRLLGVAPIVHDRFDAAAVGAERDATLVSLVPTMLARMLDAGADVARFRVILLGGAPASSALRRRAAEAGANVVVTYGMTETCGGCVYDGIPLDGVDVRVDDESVLVRGPVLTSGYRGRPDLTASAFADGWFRTNDRGFLDDAGRLVVLGRADDVIITGGKKIAASEVEHVLLAHPGIADAAVVAIPDDEWGERVAAAIVLRSESPPGEAEIVAWLRERLAPHKIPRTIVEVDALPRTERGKLMKQDLVRLVSGR